MSDFAPFEPRTILCPLDFSELSDLALKYAAAGAKVYAATLLILHAETFEVPRYFAKGERDRLMQELETAREAVRSDLIQHVRKVLGSPQVGVAERYKVMELDPVDAILEAAASEEIDLIVLGTHGYGGMKRVVLGSVVESVVRQSRVPVFTVRQKEHEFIDVALADSVPRLHRILCPVNMTEVARKALRHAVSLAERFGAQLSVLYSIERGESLSRSAAQEKLCSWIGGKAMPQCELETIVRQGDAAEQIIVHAREQKADLIVMGAEHRPFFETTFLGKTTELVMRHAPVPVFLTPLFSSS
jgi:nucleotide-binding universal stress UspA family protein